MNKHNTIYANDNINETKITKLVKFKCNTYFTEKAEHTNNITNNITRHNHNTYGHNVTNTVNQHIKHINNHGTQIEYYHNKPYNKKEQCYTC